MHNLLAITIHNSLRLKELASLLGLIAGAALFLGAMTPMGRRGGQILGGAALAVGSLLWIIALHWGH